MTTLETKVNNMKQQTIGVEVEMNSYDDMETLQDIIRILRKAR